MSSSMQQVTLVGFLKKQPALYKAALLNESSSPHCMSMTFLKFKGSMPIVGSCGLAAGPVIASFNQN